MAEDVHAATDTTRAHMLGGVERAKGLIGRILQPEEMNGLTPALRSVWFAWSRFSARPDTPSRSTYALPIFNKGFRDPGKIQFLAALDNYRAPECRAALRRSAASSAARSSKTLAPRTS